MPSPISIVPADARLIAQARRRGGTKAADKVQRAITRRPVKTCMAKEAERKQMLEDDDYTRGLRQFLKVGDDKDESK